MAQLQSAYAGHRQVGQHQIDVTLFQADERSFGIGCRNDRVGGLQLAFQILGKFVIVVDYQNCCAAVVVLLLTVVGVFGEVFGAFLLGRKLGLWHRNMGQGQHKFGLSEVVRQSQRAAVHIGQIACKRQPDAHASTVCAFTVAVLLEGLEYLLSVLLRNGLAVVGKDHHHIIALYPGRNGYALVGIFECI